MQISTDFFDRKILICFKGEYQIRLGHIIINKLLLKDQRRSHFNILGLMDKNLIDKDNHLKKALKIIFNEGDLTPYLLYYPRNNDYSMSKLSVYTFNKIEKHKEESKKINPRELQLIGLKKIAQDLGDNWEGLRIMSSLEFFNQYGKELFDSEKERDLFLEETSQITNSGILEFIKKIKY